MAEVKLSEQQYDLVSALWELKEGSARDISEARPDLGLAHTTIATILTRLEKKGVLASGYRGRERVYKPLITEGTVQRSMVGSLINTLFRGDSSALLAHLVREGDIDKETLSDIETMLAGSKKAEASTGETNNG